ncbi:transmembrane protein 44 isoform X8 [Lutra lutra]|uniref:transmembrane protein 44 isoform X8 n=1 Tax=Lutra lutra TaxID=9657 RepID=UPI001FCFA6C9|nr:transmembrane protein 44 isoform X8 [Lutra lutra]
MGEAASPAPASALWDWDYLDRCFARHRVCISFGLWICSTSCWIAAHTLLLYLRCAKKSGRDQSVLCAACCLLSSLCDTIGAILARQLTIQVFTGAYLAAADLVNFVFILFPICGCQWKSHRGRGSQERTRRQRLRASVFALALPLSLGPGWALWATTPKASGPVRGSQRRLLESLLQDNTEVLGYLLGGIAVFGSWASQIPPLSRIGCHIQLPEVGGLRQKKYHIPLLGDEEQDETGLGICPGSQREPGHPSPLDLRRERGRKPGEFRLGASHYTSTLQITQDNGSHQSLLGADHRAGAAGKLQHHQAARRWTDEPWRRHPRGAPLVPSRSGHPGPRVFQQLLRGLLHQLGPRGAPAWRCQGRIQEPLAGHRARHFGKLRLILSLWICEQNTGHILDAKSGCNSRVQLFGHCRAPSCGSQPGSRRKFSLCLRKMRTRAVLWACDGNGRVAAIFVGP